MKINKIVRQDGSTVYQIINREEYVYTEEHPKKLAKKIIKYYEKENT